jgi:hypothetical protein
VPSVTLWFWGSLECLGEWKSEWKRVHSPGFQEGGRAMAHSIEKWERAKALYQRGASVASIALETGVAQSAIYSRASRNRWKRVATDEQFQKIGIREKVEARADAVTMGRTAEGRRVLEEVEARKTLHEIDRWKAKAPPAETAVHDELVMDRLVLERSFAASAMRNQGMLDEAVLRPEVRAMGHEAVDILKKHAEATKTNKSTVLGQDPVVQVDARGGVGQAMVMMPPAMAEIDAEGIIEVDDTEDFGD